MTVDFPIVVSNPHGFSPSRTPIAFPCGRPTSLRRQRSPMACRSCMPTRFPSPRKRGPLTGGLPRANPDPNWPLPSRVPALGVTIPANDTSFQTKGHRFTACCIQGLPPAAGRRGPGRAGYPAGGAGPGLSARPAAGLKSRATRRRPGETTTQNAITKVSTSAGIDRCRFTYSFSFD